MLNTSMTSAEAARYPRTLPSVASNKQRTSHLPLDLTDPLAVTRIKTSCTYGLWAQASSARTIASLVQEVVGGELEINTAEDILNLIREYPDSLAGDTSLHLGIHLYKEIAIQEETTKEQMTHLMKSATELEKILDQIIELDTDTSTTEIKTEDAPASTDNLPTAASVSLAKKEAIANLAQRSSLAEKIASLHSQVIKLKSDLGQLKSRQLAAAGTTADTLDKFIQEGCGRSATLLMSILQKTLQHHFDMLFHDASDYGYVNGQTQKPIDQLRAVWSALDHNARQVTACYVHSVHSKPPPLPGNHSLKAYLPLSAMPDSSVSATLSRPLLVSCSRCSKARMGETSSSTSSCASSQWMSPESLMTLSQWRRTRLTASSLPTPTTR
jgi:hypothetical protein